ncbi:transcription antitermination factor NusB [Desulfurella sp.]|uniref:transcription antitermination factor NusB n=1 Tax=Desulfurella sp. TaxID=1962857 RepID=UPI0025BB8A9C|nr:transcription antitermination factor NusB [Desulfurella sp.]
MSRRTIRSEAMKFLYAKTLNDSFAFSDFLCNLTKIKKDLEKEELGMLVDGILKVEEKLEEYIKNCSKEYEKLNQLDKSILKVGAFELLYTNLPKSIVINEAVEIAKEYGDDVSKAIVNAILDCIGEKYER